MQDGRLRPEQVALDPEFTQQIDDRCQCLSEGGPHHPPRAAALPA